MGSNSQKLSILDNILINIEPVNLAVVNELYKQPDVQKFFADPELILTVQTLFDNNLNLLKTSEALIIHRNTLLYRLNKINNLLKLDIRKFDDAVTAQILLSLKRTEIKRKRHANKIAQLESLK